MSFHETPRNTKNGDSLILSVRLNILVNAIDRIEGHCTPYSTTVLRTYSTVSNRGTRDGASIRNTTPPVMIVLYGTFEREDGRTSPIFFRLTPDREQTARVGQVHSIVPVLTPPVPPVQKRIPNRYGVRYDRSPAHCCGPLLLQALAPSCAGGMPGRILIHRRPTAA